MRAMSLDLAAEMFSVYWIYVTELDCGKLLLCLSPANIFFRIYYYHLSSVLILGFTSMVLWFYIQWDRIYA